MDDSSTPDSSHPSAHGDATAEFGLLCSVCRTRMYATPAQFGQTIECPDCLTGHTVTEADAKQFEATRYQGNQPVAQPEEGKVLAPQDAGEDGDEYQLAPMEETPQVQADATSSMPPVRDPTVDTIRAPCPICNWHYSSTSADIGKKTTCPDCGNVFKIKPRRVATPKQSVVAYDPKIGIEEAGDRPSQEDNSEALMARAHAHREEVAKKKPKPVKRPFKDGIYSYPLMPRVIQGWITLPIFFCTGMMLIAYGATMEGNAAMLGMLLFVAAIPFLATTVLMTGFSMMTLMTTTANGYPQPVEWPKFDIGEWFATGLFFWCSLFVAVLPGALLSAEFPWYAKLLLYSASLIVLHPFVFLSMMDANSPVIPYSSHIHRTVQKAPSAWMKFYLASAPVFAGVLGMGMVAGFFGTTVAGIVLFIVATIVLALGMTVYFRLLGRLAWVLGDVPTLEEELRALAEEEE